MIQNIINYIDYLNRVCNYTISIHSRNKTFSGVLSQLTQYNIHSNPYCIYIKSSLENRKQCISQQDNVWEKCKNKIFYGECYAGCGEFVVPINKNDELLGFICVGGYCASLRKCHNTATEYGFGKEKLEELFNSFLKKDIPDTDMVNTLIQPLAAMLVILYSESVNRISSVGKDYIYANILSIIHTEYMSPISINHIADLCHCSPSYVSHIFKKNSGTTICKYLTDIRIAAAKKLLCNSEFSVSEIAFLTGFTDSNYFIYVFSKSCGMSPGKFRKNIKNEEVVNGV